MSLVRSIVCAPPCCCSARVRTPSAEAGFQMFDPANVSPQRGSTSSGVHRYNTSGTHFGVDGEVLTRSYDAVASASRFHIGPPPFRPTPYYDALLVQTLRGGLIGYILRTGLSLLSRS